MSDRTLGFAIIGPGIIGRVHARAIAATPGTRLVAVYGHNRQRCEEFAARHETRAADSLEALLAMPEVDVVVVTTPSGAHADLVVAAARAGKHILCEKPLDITLEQIDRMTAACAEHRVLLYPAFQNRFAEPPRLIREAIAGGRLGRPVLGRASIIWHRPQSYYQSAAWRGTFALDGGGCLMNQSIHTIDLLLSFLGEPLEVTGQVATLTHPGVEVEDTAVAVLRFASGALGTIEATTSSDPERSPSVVISGETGTVGMEGERICAWHLRDAQPHDAALRAPPTGPVPGHNDDDVVQGKHRRQLADLLQALRQGTAPAVTPVDGRLAVEVVLGIYASARSGRPYVFQARRQAAG